jgi:hypothetical protein
MSNSELQEQFLRMIRDGAGYVAVSSPSKEWKQRWCENNDEIMAHAEDYQATHNIYCSLATFPNRFNTREAKFVEKICAVWADIDRHENSIYKTDEEIEYAINHFLKSTGLPSPNIKHYTGYGMHIYWAFDQALCLGEWQPTAEQLQILLDTLKVGADPITSDAARVLRLPGTQNFRDPTNPVGTRLEIVSRELISVDEFSEALAAATKAFPAPVKKASQTAPRNDIPYTSENIALVKSMLDLLDPDPSGEGGGNRAKWMRTVWSVASTGWGEAAYDIVRQWSERGDLFDENDFNGVWDYYDPIRKLSGKKGTGFGTLVHFAREAGYGGAIPKTSAVTPVQTSSITQANGLLTTDTAIDDWSTPEPIPDGLLPIKPLDPALLPRVISDAVVDISERLNCPIEFVTAPVLTAAGVAIGNRIGVLPKKFDDSWEVFPGFWGGIVGSPGSMKTPAQNESFRSLYHLEEQAGVSYAQAMETYNKDMKVYEKQHKDFKSGKSTVWPVEPKKPPKVRYIVNDVTYQALGEILAENPSGVLALADEMSGLLQSLDTPGQEAARGFFLQGWGGRGNYTFDRITRGTVVLKNYMLSLFGGFQPDRIKLYVRAASNGNSQNDGLMQRFQLLVWPDVPDEVRIVDRLPNREAIQRMEAAIIQLRSLATSGLPDAERNSIGASLLHFDDEAQERFDDWYRKNEEMLRKDDLSQAEHSHFAKYRSLIPGLALVFHLLESHKGRICSNCLDKALGLSLVLKSHALRVYASVYGLDNEPARALAKRILKGDLQSGFTARSVYLKGWNGLNKQSVQSALEQLTELGWLREVAITTGGRPLFQYLINPKVSADLL